MSATLRYARILNGFSPLISRRSAISPRIWAMAALSNPETFRLDVKIQDARAALSQCGGNCRPAVGRAVAEEAPAATGPADFRGGGSGRAGPAHQVIDFCGGHAGRQALPVLPFGGDLTANFVPIAPLERPAHGHRRIADSFETAQHG